VKVLNKCLLVSSLVFIKILSGPLLSNEYAFPVSKSSKGISNSVKPFQNGNLSNFFSNVSLSLKE
jgi:hypothetical protein